MNKPLIAIPSFPGSNGEVDNQRTLKRCGFDCFVFRWNDSLERLNNVDGYFFGAGFSYEDRGRSGMVAARDPLLRFMHEEAKKGKVIIGNCNGAQILVESGLIPLGEGLRMCLAHNAIRENKHWISPGFLNEWVWITPTCKRFRCATSDWSGTLHIPIAHGEGRFVTRDTDLIGELKKSDQIAFQYCDQHGGVSPDYPTTPNGSTMAIAGICNPAGNVVALMPHPERTKNGDPYFLSVRRWIEKKLNIENGPSVAKAMEGKKLKMEKEFSTFNSPAFAPMRGASAGRQFSIPQRAAMPTEIFIETIIVNNEERTVEQAARRSLPALRLKQYRYVGMPGDRVPEMLSKLSFFNPNKEIAYVRRSGRIHRWSSDKKTLEPTLSKILAGVPLLRRDEPDTGAASLGNGSETGVCYDCRNVSQDQLFRLEVCEVFSNPHASTLEVLV